MATEAGEVDIVNTHNGDNPLRFENTFPLWTCDIWEHAYYIDFRNVRKKYLEQAWEHVNWSFAADNFKLKRIPI